MPSIATPRSNGSSLGRLRPSDIKAESASQPNGYSFMKLGDGNPIKTLSDLEGDKIRHGLTSQKAKTEQDEINHLIQILFSLQKNQHDPKFETSNAVIRKLLLDMLKTIPEAENKKSFASDHHNGTQNSEPGSKKQTVSSKKPMLLTSLGDAIVASSDEPVGAATGSFKLPTAKTINATKTVTGVTSVDSTPPQNGPNATSWQNIIKNGRSGAPLQLNDQTLENPSLVTADTHGNIVKVPLSTAVDAESTHVRITPQMKLAAAPIQKMMNFAVSDFSTTAVNSEAMAVIPHVLVASNLSGNESTTVPPGFILAGDIKLFGGIAAERYVMQDSGDKTEMVIVSKSPISMDGLLPQQGFSFGDIVLQSPTITLYSKTSATGRDMGLWLDATVSATGALANVSGILGDVFARSFPSLTISAHLGGYQGFGDVYKAPNDLLLKVSLTGLDAKIGKYLELTSAEVDIQGTRTQGRYDWNMSLSGSALLTVPGSVAPLSTTYTVSKSQSTYALALKLTNDQWDNAMGVPGFNLQDVSLNSSFTAQSKDNAFTFEIDASFALDTTTVSVKGNYSGDKWDFSATVGDLSLGQLEQAFAKLFKASLTPIAHNVTFTGLSLDVNSVDKRLELKGGVVVDNYSSATAVLDVGPTGVHVTGDMSNVHFDAVTLTKAHMELVIVKSGLVDANPAVPGTSAAFSILGTVQINSDISIDAEVSFAKAAGSAFVWVVYAKATLGLSLAKFVSKLPPDLDFQLEDVVAMASNTDDGSVFPAHVFEYQVKKGFHLYAKIKCPDHLAKTLHTNPGTLTLELDLSATQSEIELIFGTDQQLSLKPGMVAPSVKAGIMLSGNPQIFVEGDMAVQLRGQPEPLVFALRLSVGATEADASASLMSDWVNPFGISPKVKVLAPVSLEVVIDYAAATYPSGLAFQGGVQVGETILHAAFEVGENPEDGVLLMHAENLGIRDIVSFASLVIERQLPLPPSDIIFFKDLYLGLSTGGTIASVFYPPGVTFNADMLVFGKEITVHCAVDKQLPGFSLHAEMDAFQLGPVSVSGDQTKNPTLDLEFGTKLQSLLIDGKIDLFDSEIAINIAADLVKQSIDFDAELKFSDLLLFKLQAHAAGKIASIKDVVKVDFSLYAEFEQKLLDYMIALGNTYMTTAKKAADEGLESAKQKLDEAQHAFDNHLAQCQRELNSAQATFDRKKADVTAVVNAQTDAIHQKETQLRNEVTRAKQNFDAKIASLESSLQQTKNDAAAKISNAKSAVTTARQDGDRAVDGARSKLDAATRDMQNRFGDAEAKIRSAKNDVQSKQSDVDNTQHDLDNTSKFNIPKKAELGIKLAAEKTALGVAEGVLTAAEGIVGSVGYKAAQAAISAAQGSLDAAKATAEGSLKAAQLSLTATTTAANASISTAQGTLDAAEKSCDELHVWQAAQATLKTFLDGEAAALKAAQDMFQVLANSAEKAAFDAASKALAVARSATKELDAAKSVVDDVEKATDEFTAFGQWLIKHAGNVFNVRSVVLSGSLNDAANKKPFMAKVVGTFADRDIDVSAEFYPGQAEQFVKKLVMGFVDDAKNDITKYIHL